MNLNPWHFLVVAMAGWMIREQAAVVAFVVCQAADLAVRRAQDFRPPFARNHDRMIECIITPLRGRKVVKLPSRG